MHINECDEYLLVVISGEWDPSEGTLTWLTTAVKREEVGQLKMYSDFSVHIYLLLLLYYVKFMQNKIASFLD